MEGRSTGYTYEPDIVAGNNFGYAAKAGYDQASGIGSLVSGNALATRLTVSASPVALTSAAFGGDGNCFGLSRLRKRTTRNGRHATH